MSLTALIYGPAGAGKTPVACSTEGVTLIIAAESGHRFVGRDRPRLTWNPRAAVPTDVPENAIVVATLRASDESPTQAWEDAQLIAKVLVSGKHPFDNVVIDTLTSLQAHCIASVTARSRRGEMDQQGWGKVLSELKRFVSTVTEQVDNPVRPLSVVAATAQATMRESEGEFTPDLSGSVRTALIELFDLVGYMVIASDFDATEGPAGPEHRRLAIGPGYGAQARDRSSALPDGGITGQLGAVLTGPIYLHHLAKITS